MSKAFPHFMQHDAMDCGPTCLRAVASYYGRDFPIAQIRDWCNTNKLGSSLIGLTKGAEKMRLRSLPLSVTFEQLEQEAPLPCIAHWRGKHFVVVYKIKNGKVHVSDPAHGRIVYEKSEFLAGFGSMTKHLEEPTGFVLLLDPTPAFGQEKETVQVQTLGLDFLWHYVKKYRRHLGQIVLGLMVASVLNLIFPFLTQAIVDVGIRQQNIQFIYLILFAQLMLFASRTGIELIRNWLLMHISKRINVSLLADYFAKLMRLPIAQFDSKMIGDFVQRINDHERIEKLLTSTSLSSVFSLFTLVIFGAVLGYYSPSILFIFLAFSVLYVGWMLLFLQRRRDLDYRSFGQLSENQSKIYEVLVGMKEIKLNNAERKKRWEWEQIQARLFQTSLRGLAVGQWQQGGSLFINELKNIVITFYAAKLVLDGSITLGMMLAISYIIGQLNGPIMQFIDLLMSGQEAKISLERLAEIHQKQDEEEEQERAMEIPAAIGDIRLDEVTFRYDKNVEDFVLKGVSMDIPSCKTTAIVGSSGSGKTTLLKLLLKFYDPEKGSIQLNETSFSRLSISGWRERCGVVLQEGMLFSDTVGGNIALGADSIDYERLRYAARVANILEFIDRLPHGFDTKVGKDGIEMSTGQKQRLLIARAVYKNPDYIFFDEATSALDANNERTIMEHLESFFQGRTVVVVAHRLSTVKNADQIVVLERGAIIEQGTHTQLVERRGAYYNLVKNQLELGK
ncbi:MAG TPA: peptidase domain-containing ABC transporter [Saprospiraceae bacterium]|nr:peptidase domain-containing ABC transporter [Saprospiraceae bacterium]HPI06027.1 peptidase domain-containing ABC transporter [Saprospiraceae bacterium]